MHFTLCRYLVLQLILLQNVFSYSFITWTSFFLNTMWKGILGEKTENSAIISKHLLKTCTYFLKDRWTDLLFNISKGKDSVERHPLKARNIYRCNVIPSNEACGPSLALCDNRRIFWQRSWLLLPSACCPSKPIFDWHLCPIETGITPSEWALCQANRWVWAQACQKPSM